MKKLVAATALLAALAGAGTADAALVINQIYGGGGATLAAPLYSNDWVQLYNSGTTAINLSGYSLQYAAATNLTTFGLSHALTGTIAANSYFLVQESRGTGLNGTTADPIYDQIGGTLALSATAGKIALFSVTTTGASTVASSVNLVDLVGFGTTANFSLYPTMTANTSTTTSALRTTDALGAVSFVAGTPVLPATPTPIPAAAWLLGSGLLGLAGFRKRNA
ncbi:MAG TPA: lamin tail domain-containing protein [Desulfuromonadales bacterium]|nr:lamin tail domain-containing protein [Desulfuromonadales bacterium]